MPRPRTRTYAWEFPVRFTHWINMLAILVFMVTGIYIGDPYMHGIPSNVHVLEPGSLTPFHEYIMGYMRFAHFVAGYVFLWSFVLRIIWAFTGNKYASWRGWVPISKLRFIKIIEAAKFYSLISRTPPHPVGHTALAGLTYLFLFAIFGFEIVSGFALLSLSSTALIPSLAGGWLLSLMDLQAIRYWHHLLMYVILAFVFVHIYIAWWLDTVEKNGLIGSIFDGYKFVTGEELE